MAKKKTSTFKFSTTISITLVLFMVSVFGWLTLNLDNFGEKAREEIQVDLFFTASASDLDQKKVEKLVSSYPAVKSLAYISKEDAVKSLDEVGENAVEILGYIPVNPSLEVKLNASHAVLDSVKQFEQKIFAHFPELIEDVSYSEAQFLTLDEGISKINYFVLGIIIMLLIITIVLINNTIRLSIYSKRFIIRTMQLVGARGRFIRRPFLMEAFYQGILSSVLAISMFLGLGLVIIEFFPNLFSGSNTSSISEALNQTSLFLEYKNSIILFGGTILLGILISCLTTYVALLKYLRLRTDKLYN